MSVLPPSEVTKRGSRLRGLGSSFFEFRLSSEQARGGLRLLRLKGKIIDCPRMLAFITTAGDAGSEKYWEGVVVCLIGRVCMRFAF